MATGGDPGDNYQEDASSNVDQSENLRLVYKRPTRVNNNNRGGANREQLPQFSAGSRTETQGHAGTEESLAERGTERQYTSAPAFVPVSVIYHVERHQKQTFEGANREQLLQFSAGSRTKTEGDAGTEESLAERGTERQAFSEPVFAQWSGIYHVEQHQKQSFEGQETGTTHTSQLYSNKTTLRRPKAF